jgi:polyphosphate kinase
VTHPSSSPLNVDSRDVYINRELSWLAFARRVLELAEDESLPLLERVKFAGIMGMIFDEFVMKRMGGLRQKLQSKPNHVGYDGLTPKEELTLCRQELYAQMSIIDNLIENRLRPELAENGIYLESYDTISSADQAFLQSYFTASVLPILTPLAVDAGHPFPFISNLCLNIAALVTGADGKRLFIRLKIPANRKRWVILEDGVSFVPLEEVIARNLHLLFPNAGSFETYFFRVTRAAKDNPWDRAHLDEIKADDLVPGSIISMVTAELNYRKFAGIIRLEVSESMPPKLQLWLAEQLGITSDSIVPVHSIIGCGDLLDLKISGHDELRDPPHRQIDHPRLKNLPANDSQSFFDEIRSKDILIHLPYHNFDTSVLHLLQHAARDPQVLAIKLTIYRTSSQSRIIRALMEAAQRGKQVAVLVEITARFDEAPNIAWGRQLEQAGAHVVYGVERLKTHVKLAMIVREEHGGIKRYVHLGTGNYHPGTARIYGDLGIMSCNEALGEDVSRLFNELTGAIPAQDYRLLLVAPHNMRQRFTALIRNEVDNIKAGKPAGIRAKCNQLQDRLIIRELYLASQAGVPISLNVRGLCSLKPGVPGLSETIRVYSILGRFLEHSRIYRFENGGDPLFLIGSADWMKRNLDRRMESIMPVLDSDLQAELETILSIYERDNIFSWDMQPDGSYRRNHPAAGEQPLAAQPYFMSTHYTPQSDD